MKRNQFVIFLVIISSDDTDLCSDNQGITLMISSITINNDLTSLGEIDFFFPSSSGTSAGCSSGPK